MTVTSVLTSIAKLTETKQPFIVAVTTETAFGRDFVEVKFAEC